MISSHLSLSRLLVSSGLSRGLEKCGQNRNLFEVGKKTYTEANSGGAMREGFGYFSSIIPTMTSESGIHLSPKLITGTFPSGFTSKNLKSQPENKIFSFRMKKKSYLWDKKESTFFFRFTIWACH